MQQISETGSEIEILYDKCSEARKSLGKILENLVKIEKKEEHIVVPKHLSDVKCIDLDDDSDDDVECLGSYLPSTEIQEQQNANKIGQNANSSLVEKEKSRSPKKDDITMVESVVCSQTIVRTELSATFTQVPPSNQQSSSELENTCQNSKPIVLYDKNIVDESHHNNHCGTPTDTSCESICLESQMSTMTNNQEDNTSSVTSQLERKESNIHSRESNSDSEVLNRLTGPEADSSTNIINIRPTVQTENSPEKRMKRFISIPAKFLSGRTLTQVTNNTPTGSRILKFVNPRFILKPSKVDTPVQSNIENSTVVTPVQSSVDNLTFETPVQKYPMNQFAKTNSATPTVINLPKNPNIIPSKKAPTHPPSMLFWNASFGKKLVKLKGTKESQLKNNLSKTTKNTLDKACRIRPQEYFSKNKPSKSTNNTNLTAEKVSKTSIYSLIHKNANLYPSERVSKKIALAQVSDISEKEKLEKQMCPQSKKCPVGSEFPDEENYVFKPNEPSISTLPHAYVPSTCKDVVAKPTNKNLSFKHQPQNAFQEVLYSDLGLLRSESETETNQTNSIENNKDETYMQPVETNTTQVNQLTFHPENNVSGNTTYDHEQGIYVSCNPDNTLDLAPVEPAMVPCPPSSTFDTEHLVGVFNKLVEDIRTCLCIDAVGNMPIHQAVLDSDIVKLKTQCIVLRTIGSHINHINLRHETALMLAVSAAVNTNDYEAASVLLNEGADQRIADMDGNTPLHLAVSHGCDQLVKLLLTGSDADQVTQKFNYAGFTPLHIAAMEGYDEIIKLLVGTNIFVDIKDRKNGRTPYYLAVKEKKLLSAQLLRMFGADANEPNFADYTPQFDDSSPSRPLPQEDVCANNQARVFPNLFEVKMPSKEQDLLQVSLSNQLIEPAPSLRANAKGFTSSSHMPIRSKLESIKNNVPETEDIKNNVITTLHEENCSKIIKTFKCRKFKICKRVSNPNKNLGEPVGDGLGSRPFLKSCLPSTQELILSTKEIKIKNVESNINETLKHHEENRADEMSSTSVPEKNYLVTKQNEDPMHKKPTEEKINHICDTENIVNDITSIHKGNSSESVKNHNLCKSKTLNTMPVQHQNCGETFKVPSTVQNLTQSPKLHFDNDHNRSCLGVNMSISVNPIDESLLVPLNTNKQSIPSQVVPKRYFKSKTSLIKTKQSSIGQKIPECNFSNTKTYQETPHQNVKNLIKVNNSVIIEDFQSNNVKDLPENNNSISKAYIALTRQSVKDYSVINNTSSKMILEVPSQSVKSLSTNNNINSNSNKEVPGLANSLSGIINTNSKVNQEVATQSVNNISGINNTVLKVSQEELCDIDKPPSGIKNSILVVNQEEPSEIVKNLTEININSNSNQDVMGKSVKICSEINKINLKVNKEEPNQRVKCFSGINSTILKINQNEPTARDKNPSEINKSILGVNLDEPSEIKNGNVINNIISNNNREVPTKSIKTLSDINNTNLKVNQEEPCVRGKNTTETNNSILGVNQELPSEIVKNLTEINNINSHSNQEVPTQNVESRSGINSTILKVNQEEPSGRDKNSSGISNSILGDNQEEPNQIDKNLTGINNINPNSNQDVSSKAGKKCSEINNINKKVNQEEPNHSVKSLFGISNNILRVNQDDSSESVKSLSIKEFPGIVENNFSDNEDSYCAPTETCESLGNNLEQVYSQKGGDFFLSFNETYQDIVETVVNKKRVTNDLPIKKKSKPNSKRIKKQCESKTSLSNKQEPTVNTSFTSSNKNKKVSQKILQNTNLSEAIKVKKHIIYYKNTTDLPKKLPRQRHSSLEPPSSVPTSLPDSAYLLYTMRKKLAPLLAEPKYLLTSTEVSNKEVGSFPRVILTRVPLPHEETVSSKRKRGVNISMEKDKVTCGETESEVVVKPTASKRKGSTQVAPTQDKKTASSKRYYLANSSQDNKLTFDENESGAESRDFPPEAKIKRSAQVAHTQDKTASRKRYYVANSSQDNKLTFDEKESGAESRDFPPEAKIKRSAQVAHTQDNKLTYDEKKSGAESRDFAPESKRKRSTQVVPTQDKTASNKRYNVANSSQDKKSGAESRDFPPEAKGKSFTQVLPPNKEVKSSKNISQKNKITWSYRNSKFLSRNKRTRSVRKSARTPKKKNLDF